MARAAGFLLLALAMFNIVHGDLLRPCACSAENASSCGYCPASRVAKAGPSGESQAPC